MKTVIRNNYTPHTEDYCNTIVIDAEHNIKYIFDCDGVYSKFTNFAPSTIDYNDLVNKPSINGVELKGDKSFEELHLNRITDAEINNITAV